MNLNKLKFIQSLTPKYKVEQRIEFPIYEFDLQDRLDNDKILKLIKETPANFEKTKLSPILLNPGIDEQHGGYESKYDLYNYPQWEFFVDAIISVVKEIENRLYLDTQIKVDPTFFNLWCTWYNENSGQSMHQHGFRSKWAAVYYVQAGDNDAPIVFRNKDSELKIQPKTGHLLIFPGACWHRVELQKNSSKRIVIAGNIG